MPVGDEVLLTIESIALSGEGIAKKDGVVFFVDGALPNEEVKARILKIEKNLIRTKLSEIMKESADRMKPLCPHFGICGGCAFQHLKYEKQLEIKQRELIQMMKRLGGFKDDIEISSVIPSPNQYYYRNAVAMTVRHQAQEPFLGFIAKDNRTFIPIDQCVIAEKQINDHLSPVRKRFGTVVPEHKRYKTSQVVIRMGNGSQIYTSIKKDPESTEELCAVVGGKKFFYSGSSFFQTNFSILESMVGAVRNYLVRSSEKSLLVDLYSGVGFFSLSLADCFSQVIGIEESREATAYAVRNSNANSIKNAQFISGKVEMLLSQISADEQSDFCILVDPPRAGMQKEVCEHLAQLKKVKRLVYISCNPATFIRDAQILSSKFSIKKIQPLDMFPHTKHLELISLLEPHP